MAGLDPAIHALVTSAGDASNRMDARVKPAHDDLWLLAIETQQSNTVPRQPCARAGMTKKRRNSG
jgi:hypothetical protein